MQLEPTEWASQAHGSDARHQLPSGRKFGEQAKQDGRRDGIAYGGAGLEGSAHTRYAIVLDIAMPLSNGLDAARQLKKTMPAIKLIFLTMNEDPNVANEAFRAGASGYLLKTSAASELSKAIKEALDPETGKMILPVQSYLVRTGHHTILIDTCIGCRKSYDGAPEWKDLRDENWLHNLAAAGVGPGEIDYVFCTHLHSNHCGWNTRLVDGRWTPTFPNARYILAAGEYAASEAEGTAIFHENVLPIMEAGQAVLVDTDYALDDEVWLTPAPGHTAGHVAVNIASQGHNAVMIGDMMHSPIQLAHPEWSPNFEYDPALSTETRRRFLDSHCETDTLVLTAHFPSPSVGHVVRHAERAFDFEYLPPVSAI